MTLLSVTGIQKRVQPEFVLKDISFSQRRNENLAISGESGSGKTTLLRIIAGLVQPDRGKVYIEGEIVKGPADLLVPGHPKIAFLSQHFELPKFLRVGQTLAYANHLSDEDAQTLFRLCRIEHLLNRDTRELAGGERQRIAICRLLIGKPSLLLLDEPFAHLDLAHKEVLKAVVHDIGQRLRITCLLVSHDPLDMLPWADRILVMRRGELLQSGKPAQVFHRPKDEYVAGLFGKYSLIPPVYQPLFMQSGTRKLSRKPWIVRPGALRIGPRNSGGVRGKVESVSFLGNVSELQVRINEDLALLVNDPNGMVAVGDTVYLSL